jgi:hypothetical protein
MFSKLKRLPTEWEKNFVSYTSDKSLITRKYSELKKFKLPKIQWSNEETDKRTDQRFFKGRSPNG